jgi:hypothetical protein
MKACQVTPNQNIKTRRPTKTNSSREVKSAGIVWRRWVEAPNKTFIQIRKKKVGAIKYKSTIKSRHKRGKRSKKNEKKRISATNIIEPGKPKKTKVLTRVTTKSLGHKKLIPLISVINRVLNLRPMASTRKNELVDKSA